MAENKPASGTDGKAAGKKSGGLDLQQFATILGLVAFLLGVQSYGELRDRIFPHPVVPSSSPSAAVTPDREAVKWRYVATADASCARTFKGLPVTKGGDTTYGWMTAVLAVRRRNLTAWQAVPWPATPVDPVYRAELSKLWSDFDEATRYWEAMANDLRAKNRVQYNFDRGTFLTARDSFVEGANRFGFRACNEGYPTTTAWE